jgi:predicted CopG family antitoxin
MGITTIQVNDDVKKKLDNLKVHPRESYNELLERMAQGFDIDKESLVETIEIMSDPDLMRSIAKSVEQFKKGEWKTLEEVEAEIDSGKK